MSKANPKKAIAALLPPGTAVIRPMTLGVYAALERIGSPLVTGEEPKDTLDLIPSLYLLTHDPREVLSGNIVADALAWADTQPVTVVEEIRRAAEAEMGAFFDVRPQDDGQKKTTSKVTGGSSRSSIGRRGGTTSATTKSCGKSRQVRSHSSTAKSGRRTTAHGEPSR